VGRRGTFFAVGLTALAFASSAQAKPLLGITGDLPRFQTLTGQASTVHQAFLGWGQGLSYGSPFVSLFGTLTPIPMIHLGTAKGTSHKEAITPAQIAAGKGDGYLIGLNQAIAQWGKAIYVRPMAEMNNYINLWSGFRANGSAKPGHSPADYRKAFARIYLILHGGSAASINAKLKALGMPPINGDLASNPFPRLRIVWSPIARGNPRIAANEPENYYPGKSYVDVDAGDIFDESLTDTAPWTGLEALYTASIGHGRPFAVPEWGLYVDDPTFIKHMCTFLKTHPRTEEAGFYDSRPGSPLDIEPKTLSKKEYRDCITPLGAPLPGWASGSSQPGTTPASTTATISFTGGGQTLGSVSAPIGADEIELDMTPATGIVVKAYWIRGGKSLGPMNVPSGATGVVFQTKSGGAAPTPLIRPRVGTDFHVKWSSSGTITSAWWTRVGKLLAQIPVTAGETSIAMTQGS
jgi:hypothetical protein